MSNYAIVSQNRAADGEMCIARVYTGFWTRAEAEAYNDDRFPRPDYNVIVPWSSK